MDEQPPRDQPTPPTSDAPPPPPPVPPVTPTQPPAQWATPTGSAAPPTGSNGLAVAALVLGIIGLIMFWSIWLGVILGALAIVFGVMGRNKAVLGAPNKGAATAGLVLGILAVLASLLWLASIVAFVEDNEDLLDDLGSQIEFCIENPNDPTC